MNSGPSALIYQSIGESPNFLLTIMPFVPDWLLGCVVAAQAGVSRSLVEKKVNSVLVSAQH
jgi:hypothetical protein